MRTGAGSGGKVPSRRDRYVSQPTRTSPLFFSTSLFISVEVTMAASGSQAFTTQVSTSVKKGTVRKRSRAGPLAGG